MAEDVHVTCRRGHVDPVAVDHLRDGGAVEVTELADLGHDEVLVRQVAHAALVEEQSVDRAAHERGIEVAFVVAHDAVPVLGLGQHEAAAGLEELVGHGGGVVAALAFPAERLDPDLAVELDPVVVAFCLGVTHDLDQTSLLVLRGQVGEVLDAVLDDPHGRTTELVEDADVSVSRDGEREHGAHDLSVGVATPDGVGLHLLSDLGGTLEGGACGGVVLGAGLSGQYVVHVHGVGCGRHSSLDED